MNISRVGKYYTGPINIGLKNILLAVYLFIAVWLIRGYFSWDINVYLGLITAPFICTVDKTRRSIKFLVPALLAAGLAVMLPVKTMLFIAILFGLMFLVENSAGKISNTVLFLLLVVSPVFKYMARLIELPIRLWLTDEVATLLNTIGTQAKALGNQIILNKYEFSVDPACAGLNMLATSLIICLFVVGFYQRQTQKQLHFLVLSGLLLATVGLNVICNFFRITFLVLFKVMPETFFHDFIGMFCLIVYVIAPLMYACKVIVVRFAKPAFSNAKPTIELPLKDLRYPLLHISLLAAVIFVTFHLSAAQSSGMVKAIDINLGGYHKKELADGVLKFENKEALIYLKPTAFYAPEHDPMVCWTGSGYLLKNVRQETISGQQVYAATLEKGTDKLYTAWWFDNGALKTTDQLLWRWKAAKGASQFYLVNVNAATPALLRDKADDLLSRSNYLKKIK